MQGINIARAIVEGRKARGITQETLAQHMGVSKASVSKWETGQSYPDITFLPQLATYFNMSIDELMGYEPQMTKEEIRRQYHQLAEKFVNLPFEDVLDECHQTIRKYYSCFPLLLQMAILLLNHLNFAPTEEARSDITLETRDLCRRVKAESGDLDLAKQANLIEAICELSLGNPAAVIDLLEPVNDPFAGDEVLVATAYHALGEPSKAKETTQVAIFRHLMAIFGILPSYLPLNTDDVQKYGQIVARGLGLIELFDVQNLHPAILFAFYLSGAQGYVMLGDVDKALDVLEHYVDLATRDIYPITFSGDAFFDKVETWFADFDLGAKPPRSDAAIREGMVDALTQNPAFAALTDNERFKKMVRKLEQLKTRGD